MDDTGQTRDYYDPASLMCQYCGNPVRFYTDDMIGHVDPLDGRYRFWCHKGDELVSPYPIHSTFTANFEGIA